MAARASPSRPGRRLGLGARGDRARRRARRRGDAGARRRRPPRPARERTGGLAYESFGAARLDRLVAERTPVFVNLTAAWCITCLVNERPRSTATPCAAPLPTHEIVALKGDWTRQDPEITALLQKFGRSGVPLYLLYDRGGTPTVLPQILTEATILDAIGRI